MIDVVELKACNLIKEYLNRKVVEGMSMSVKQGEIVGLLGPNGAGKTTSFYMLVGLVTPDSGGIFLNNENITRLPLWERAKKGIGYLPQESSVFRDISVEDNIMAALEVFGVPKKDRKDKLEKLLKEFTIEKIRKNKGRMLSGGERRRVEMARLLATDPTFVLLDEPFAGVDPIAIKGIQNLIKKLKDKNIGVLITDHNVDETLTITDRAYLMSEGKLLKSGTTQELVNDPKVRATYLGENFTLKDNF